MKLLYFTASWCGPCQTAKRALAAWRKKNPDVEVEIVDLDTEDGDALRRARNVRNVPAFLFVGGGGGTTLLARESGWPVDLDALRGRAGRVEESLGRIVAAIARKKSREGRV